MSRRDHKQKKKKRREEKLRKRKHAQRFLGFGQAGCFPVGGTHYDGDSHDFAAALPPRFTAERALLKEAKGLAGSDDPKEQAQELAFQALETEDQETAKGLAQQALGLDPDCVDALAVWAHLNATSPQDEIAALEQAVATGARVLGGQEFFEQNKGQFWSLVRTRPYMRARENLGQLLSASGRIREAIPHFEALLELDASDSQGSVNNLLGCYLQETDLASPERLFARFEADESACFNWGRVLARFLAEDRPGAASALLEAEAQNRHVQGFLLGGSQPSRHGGYYEPGSREEAAVVFVTQGLAWYKHKEALDWLADDGPAYTKEETAQSIASYQPPLATFFQLGKDGVGDTDYASLGLTAAHVPELLRMAADPCLHEAREETVYCAPVHAWYALGELRAESAVEPLLRLLVACGSALDVGHEEIPVCLGLIGPAALLPLSKFLADESNALYPRVAAAQGLEEVGKKHQESRPECVRLLVSQLQHYSENGGELNAFIISNLINLHAVEALPVIEQAFAAEAVDEGIVGALESVRGDIGAVS